MKPQKLNTKLKNLILIIIILILIITSAIWLIKNVKFDININVPFMDNFGNNINTDLDIEDVPLSEKSCSLDFSKNIVCINEEFTATLRGGMNDHCYIFAGDGSGWDAVYEGFTNDNGVWFEQKQISEAGTWDLRGFCDLDEDGDFSEDDCYTNIEPLEVKSCPEPDTTEDGTHVGGIGGSTIISDEGAEIIIDLSGIEGGNCDLMAQISYSWDYVNPDMCFGIQSMESIHFEFHDSTDLIWEQDYINPIGMGFETQCGLNWDGVNNWIFTANKVANIEGCELEVEFDINVLTCNCK